MDPNNTSFHIRNANVGMVNKTQHSFYDLAVFSGYFGFYRTSVMSGAINWTNWIAADSTLVTDAGATWPSTWAPRDTTTPGGVARFVDSTYPATAIDATGLSLSFSGTRPGYRIDDIAPGATGTWNERFQIERPMNNGAYAWTTYQYLSGKTCLPVPTIATITEVSTTVLAGTGSNVGDPIEVTDDQGNVLGTTVVGADLTWTLALPTPLDVSVRTVTAVETDEFGFTAETSTVPPMPTVSIGDFVWFDRDGDGVQDSGEPGIDGVSLSVAGPDGAVIDQFGNTVAPTTTDASGHYVFAGLPTLPAGQHYVVTLDPAGLPAGYVPTPPGGDSNSGTAESGDLTTHGQSDQDLDFGFYQPIDLAIQKSVTTAGGIFAGSTVEFSLTPSNNGPGIAVAGWKVTDVVPAGLTVTAMSGVGYDCDVTARECVADAALDADTQGQAIVVTAAIADNTLGTLSNVAMVAAATSDVDEVNLENNTVSVSFESKLKITPSPTPTPSSNTTPSTSSGPSATPSASAKSSAALAATGGEVSSMVLPVGALLLIMGIGALLHTRRRGLRS